MIVLAIGEAPPRRKAATMVAPLSSLKVRIDRELRRRESLELVGVNLFDEPQTKQGKGSAFPIREARPKAAYMLKVMRLLKQYDEVWFVGSRVANAFGCSRVPLFERVDLEDVRPPAYVVPHPSGVNHWWNDEANRADWRDFVRRRGTR